MLLANGTPLRPHERLLLWGGVRALLEAGESQRDIARITRASRATIRRIALQLSRDPDGRELPQSALRPPGRPAKAGTFRELAREQLRSEPWLSSKEIIRRARERGYTGGKTMMYGIVALLRSEAAWCPPEMHSIPGALSRHDLGNVDVRFASGARSRIFFLASRLDYSRWLEVSILPMARDVESMLRTLVRHFTRMGGVPLSAVLFVPQSLKLRIRSADSSWHREFAKTFLDLGVGVVVRSPGDPADSGPRLAPYVSAHFFRKRRFRDIPDVEDQLVQWVKRVNMSARARGDESSPANRLHRIERMRLRPIKT